MKAVVYEAIKGLLTVQQMPDAHPPADGVVIRVTAKVMPGLSIVMLAVCFPVSAVSASAQTALSSPLPKDVVEVWTKAGAVDGRMGLEHLDSSDTFILRFFDDQNAKKGQIPAFSFANRNVGTIGHLPVPEPGFGVSLQQTKTTNSDLKELAGLQQLQALNLFGTEVTDLKELSGLKSLKWLTVAHTKLTDDGLKGLADIKTLEALFVDQTEINGSGFKGLELSSLRMLDLGNARVTNAGMKGLAGLKSLKYLDLRGNSRLTETGIKELAGLQSLETLFITFANDRHLKELSSLKSLKKLVLLSSTGVTDKGLKELAGLQSLQTLEIYLGEVTDAGVAELQKSLPKLKVKRDD
jgi:hypothetical protein